MAVFRLQSGDTFPVSGDPDVVVLNQPGLDEEMGQKIPLVQGISTVEPISK
jgi:hypothetical protein